MQINREIITKELDKLIETIFALSEVTAVKIRDVVMKNLYRKKRNTIIRIGPETM